MTGYLRYTYTIRYFDAAILFHGTCVEIHFVFTNNIMDWANIFCLHVLAKHAHNTE